MTPGGPSWNLEPIVAGLRDRRAGSEQSPEHEWTAERLPSGRVLGGIVEGLVAALFPKHFGGPDQTDEGVDYFVGHTLDAALRLLLEQVRRELRVAARPPAEQTEAVDERGITIVRDFAAGLPGIRAQLEHDIAAAFRGDPAARSLDEVLSCYPGITAVAHHRLAHALHALGTPLLARMIAEIAHSATGIDIHPGATIGDSFFIDHGTGVVIGETAIIGKNVRVYQAVTLGAKRFDLDERGALVKGFPRHPIVEDDVVIYAGATILGRVTIGRGSVIGGNVWLTRSVPPGSNITQALARSDVFDAGAGI